MALVGGRSQWLEAFAGESDGAARSTGHVG